MDAVKGIQYVMGWDETGALDKPESILTIDEGMPEFEIKKISGIDEYLEFIKGSDFTVFISVRDEASNNLSDSTKDILRSLNLTTEWNDEMRRKAYIAIFDRDHVITEMVAKERTGEPLMVTGNIDGISYSVLSAGYENDGGADSSIIMDGIEWSRKSRGFNIAVLFDGKVVDSVGFDTWADGNAKAVR